MDLALAVFVVVGFAFLVERLDLAAHAREVFNRSSDCLRVLRSPTLDDETKQKKLQDHSLRLFSLLGILTGGSLLALLLPVGGVWLLDGAGVASLRDVLSTLGHPVFLTGTTLVGLIGYAVLRRGGTR